MDLTGSPNQTLDGHSRTIARGAWINTIGAVLRGVLVPLQIAVFGRLFGASALGLFLWCYSCIEISTAVSTSGFADGAIVFGSRFARDASAFARHGRTLVRITAGLSATLAVILAIAAYPLEQATRQQGLAVTLWWLCAVVPLTALTKIFVSLPKARHIMGHDVWALALTLPLAAMAFAWLWSGAVAPQAAAAMSYTGAYGCAFVVSVFLLMRLFPLGHLLGGEGARKEEVQSILRFAIPQNLNMALNQLLTNTDLLMLGALGAPASDVALYGIGAQIIGNIRQTRTVVSDSLAPALARALHEGDKAAANSYVSKASSWVMSLAVPAIALVACFPRELVNLFSTEFSGSLTFMYVLLAYPLFNCALGLMGNALIMSGHPKVNLLNSLAVGTINVALNFVWIPRFGMTGAAMATAVATVSISLIQVIEARVILGMQVPWARILSWVATGATVFGLPFVFGSKDWPFQDRALAFAPVLFAWLLGIYWKRRRLANHR